MNERPILKARVFTALADPRNARKRRLVELVRGLGWSA